MTIPAKKYVAYCKRCGEDTEHYENDRKCVPCRQACRSREYQKNKARYTAKRKEQYAAMADQAKADAKRWREENPERAKENSARWGQRNPELKKQKTREWYENNKERSNENSRLWNEANPDATRRIKREAARRRRARKRGNGVEPYSELDIFERDGWICYLCDEPVDPCAPRRSDAGATIDHIIPISQGGPDSPDNVATAHWLCNRLKKTMSVDKAREMLCGIWNEDTEDAA